MTALVAPSSDVDLWSDEVIVSPYSAYDALRSAGALVYLPAHDVWAVTRYEQVREVLGDWQRFTSTQGVGMNPVANSAKGVLGVDPPLHGVMRGVLSAQLSPRGIRSLTQQLEASADTLVAALVERGSFDAVTDLAEVFPVSVVAQLIGLPEEDWPKLLPFAEAAFTCFGPMNERTRAHLPEFEAFLQFCAEHATRDRLRPGSWGMAAYDAADRGEFSERIAASLLAAYVGAGIDTTISALASSIMLFGQHPAEWAAVREDPSLISSAFIEALRLESPVQRFTRVATSDYDVDGVVAPAGSRLLVLYGCANRDERKYPDPERFDVRRNPATHLAFGFGMHGCAGQFLARLEGQSVLASLARRVSRFDVGPAAFQLNNVTRRLTSLPLRIR